MAHVPRVLLDQSIRRRRRLGASPRELLIPVARSPRPPSSTACVIAERERATASRQIVMSSSGVSAAAECHSQSGSASQSTVSHGGPRSRPCSRREK